MITRKKEPGTAQQHICLLHGWISALLTVQGDHAIIIHSDTDCSNLISKTKLPYQDWKDRIFCTNIDDSDIVLGKSIKELEACIESVIAETSPSTVLILASCMSLLIHDNVEAVLHRLRKKHDIPLIYKKTSGFSFKDPKEVIDECGIFLFDLPSKEKKEARMERTINLIGFDYETGNYLYGPQKKTSGLSDLRKDLESIGHITVRSVLNPYAPLTEWHKASQGALNVSMDTSIYQGLCAHLQKERQIPTIECPYPAGIGATLEFYTRIAEHFGQDRRTVLSALAQKIKKSRAASQKHARLFKGRPLLYNIATSVDFTVSNSAKEGTLFLDFFRELGFDITLLVQGNPEPENRARIAGTLARLKVTEPFVIFGHCGDAYRAFPQKGPAVIFGSPLLREQAARYGHVFVDFTELSIGLSGHVKNVEFLAGAIKKTS